MKNSLNNNQNISTPLYRSNLIYIAQFKIHPSHPDFSGPHQISGGALVVFPRTSVTITHEGKKPITANPNTVMFYNNGQVYSRGMFSEKGDICDLFSFDSNLILDVMRLFRNEVEDSQTLFEFSYAHSDSYSYFMQRMIVNYIQLTEQPDYLMVDETVIFLLKQVIEDSYHLHRLNRISRRNITYEKDIVETILVFLSSQFNKDISLNSIASHLNYSPFHLCRVFQKHTGKSIHKYLKELRLRIALELITQPNIDISHLALQMGFSSHSHFTEAFRKTFGIPPTHVRTVSRQTIREFKSKISIV